MAPGSKQAHPTRIYLLLRAIDKTIAEVAAQDGGGVEAKLDALYKLRERVAREALADASEGDSRRIHIPPRRWRG